MKMFNLTPLLLLACLVLIMPGCSDDDDPVAVDTDYDFSEILIDFSEKVVVATYADMRAKSVILNETVDAFAADPGNQGLLDSAASAWRDVRAPWEAGEAFLFGPAAFMGLDPSLDSWPLDHQQLQDVLGSTFDLTPAFVADGLGPLLRGFHSVEYLLFREGESRTAADLTAREVQYLVAVTTVLADDCDSLWSAWANGYDGGDAYSVELASSGQVGSRYLNQHDAVMEIIEGMIAICDEVANGKIADPYDEQDPSLVESQFSFNSLLDFQNNIRSVQNSYLGGYQIDGIDGTGLDEFVAGIDASLDLRLKAEISQAISQIASIPAPFRDNLSANTQIEAAQAAVVLVMNSLETDLKPLVSN